MRIADEFAKRGLTKEEFSRLREPLRASATENLRNNGWWIQEVLTRAQSQPAVLTDARMLATVFDELTRDEVNRVAAKHFRSATPRWWESSLAPRNQRLPETAI